MVKKKTNEVEVLNQYQHARRRTEMYLSSRDPHTQTVLEYVNGKPTAMETSWVPALFTAYREVLDNAVDELITHKSGDRLDISYNPNTMEFMIKDNGRGIPIGIHAKTKTHEATVALSTTLSGRNFNDDERGASRGLNGVGASIVNFCSEYFKVEICRDKKNFSQCFSETETDLRIDPPVILPAQPRQSTGTAIRFKLSSKVFKHMVLPESFIKARVFEIALCYPDLRVYYNGDRVQAKGGPDKVLFGNLKPITFDIEEGGKFKSRFWLVPNFFENKSEHVHSLVNGIPVFNGGTHIEAFRKNFYTGILNALAGQAKKRKLSPNRSDMADGMLLFNITEMDAPAFDSQSKTRLINEHVSKIVNGAMNAEDFFKSVIRRNPEWIETIFERCAERTQKKDAAEVAKLSKGAKRQKVEKLSDASGYDRSKCILFLAEGDSAISGLLEARDPSIHGGLPLRGKVLNVHPSKVSIKEVLKNDALNQIISSIGLVVGERANRHKLRYGQIMLTVDADEDGKNILALLVNFFYHLWPELFDADKPFIYAFDTPLIIAAKGKQRKYWYSDNYSSFDQDSVKGWELTRAKGLAALRKEDWKNCLANPKAQPIVDDGNLKSALDLLFNEGRADARKEWMGI